MAMDIEQLEEWLNAAKVELLQAHTALSNSQIKVKETEDRISSLENLMLLKNSDSFSTTLTQGDSSDELLSATEEILRDTGMSMRISDIRDELMKRRVPLPGKGQNANLIAKFQRSEGRIIRVGYGIYDIPREKPKAQVVFSDNRSVPIFEEITLGRSDDNNVILTDPLASRHHTKITIDSNYSARIIDNKSVNKTLVNGRAITDAELHDGDEIVIGDTVVKFSFF